MAIIPQRIQDVQEEIKTLQKELKRLAKRKKWPTTLEEIKKRYCNKQDWKHGKFCECPYVVMAEAWCDGTYSYQICSVDLK